MTNFESLKTRAENLASISTSIGVVCSYLAGFPDPALLREMLRATAADPARIAAEGEFIVAADRNLAGHLAAFTAAGLKLFGQNVESWSSRKSMIQSIDARQLHLVRCAYRAMALDALFSNAEGDKSVEFKRGETTADIQRQLESIEPKTMASPDRFTPIGTPTDDTQFLISGFLASRLGDSHFTENILALWRKMGGNVWRNEGARLRAFVDGDEAAFRGKATLGDLLRFAAFSAIDEPTTRKEQFTLYCNRTKLSESQTRVGEAFLVMHDELLKNNIPQATLELARMLSAIDRDDHYMHSFAKAVKLELFDKSDLVGYLVEMKKLGNDYDTFAFLGGLLLPLGSFDGTEIRPMAKSAGDTVTSVLYGYLFRDSTTEVPVPDAKELLTMYFAGEFQTNEHLQLLRDCNNAEELELLLHSTK